MSGPLDRFASRLVRAAGLDPAVYEEVEADASAMGQSILVILLAGFATGVLSLLRGELIGVLNAVLFSVVAWLICGVAAWVVGTRLLAEPETRADLAEMLRVTGFSSAPGLLRVLGWLPVVGGAVFVVTGFWMLVAMVVAIRQTLDYRSAWRAVVVAVVAWTCLIVVSLLPLVYALAPVYD